MQRANFELIRIINCDKNLKYTFFGAKLFGENSFLSWGFQTLSGIYLISTLKGRNIGIFGTDPGSFLSGKLPFEEITIGETDDLSTEFLKNPDLWQ